MRHQARKGPRISANIGRLFAEHALPDRIEAAAHAGFSGVDIPNPYNHPAPALRDAAIFAGLPILRIDAPPPNYTGGPRGFAGLPDRVDRFRRDVARVGRQADVLGCRMIRLDPGDADAVDRAALIDNLAFAAEQAPKSTFLLALLNPRDFPGHCLATAEDARAVLDATGRDNVALLFSSWHATRQPDGLRATWEACADRVGHVLLGGGHAGETDHRGAALIELLKMSAYEGWVCADYTPKGATQASLGWLTS